ncbi:hypothetical protein BJP25_23675 [Actinokineospora bangkokensis]|uniref:Asp23/Gls24 family envelope stress response protein n=1 Tax=Actinokineospora bangkokensis TaxID=1193682 RepID=A0A1Q9LIG5_9PSEU|nr:hypothetical protein BJP25_23675 [Actinokineospora bangkokensis]
MEATAGTDSRCTWAVGTPVLAALAADAAAGVAGVVRLEVGVTDLVGTVVHQARLRLAGVTPAPADGVRVRVDQRDGGVEVELDLAVDGFDQVTAVARAVQRAVRDRVLHATGIRLRAVAVSVLTITDRGAP